MSELVFLRSKTYAFLLGQLKTVKKLKGISKPIVKNLISFEDYKNAVLNPYSTPVYRKNYSMNSRHHEMFVFEQTKKAISPFDDKRYILEDAINTIPHGSDELYFI